MSMSNSKPPMPAKAKLSVTELLENSRRIAKETGLVVDRYSQVPIPPDQQLVPEENYDTPPLSKNVTIAPPREMQMSNKAVPEISAPAPTLPLSKNPELVQTKVTLPKPLARRAKALAAMEGISLGKFYTQALTHYLESKGDI